MSDPTAGISTDFARFVQARDAEFATHVEGGVPDYAFSLDWSIRRKLDMVAPLRKLAEAMTSGTVPVQRALFEANGVAVGPGQFPQLHDMGVQCAERLGIGIPQLFVIQEPRINAFTYATGEVDQIVVLTSGLVDAADPAELHTVIGHECGHIHNRHVVYNTLWEILTNDIARGILSSVLRRLARASVMGLLVEAAFSAAVSALFYRWHRCAELTCDRAGLICSGDVGAARRLPGKLSLGQVGDLEGFSADAYANQLKSFSKSTMKLTELFMSHPLGPVRTQAIDAFLDCDVLHSWRPELRTPTQRTKQEVDDQVGKIFL